MTTEETWYKTGLRFQCTQCGNCCTGAPGVVWVTEVELAAIARHKGISIGELRIQHTRLVGERISLREFANGDCVFLDPQTRGCTIYPERPAQCRTWPFWNSNLSSEDAWDRAREKCPGMGQGDLVQLDVILKQAAVIEI